MHSLKLRAIATAALLCLATARATASYPEARTGTPGVAAAVKAEKARLVAPTCGSHCMQPRSRPVRVAPRGCSGGCTSPTLAGGDPPIVVDLPRPFGRG